MSASLRQQNEPSDPDDKQGWLSKLLTVRKIDPGKQSHSRLLADKDTVYELQSKSPRL